MKTLKKLRSLSLLACFIMVSISAAIADTEPALTAEEEATLEKIEQRVDELTIVVNDLKVAKKKATNKEERQSIKTQLKEVKGELNALDAQAKELSNGIYIGSGTLILIIILIILL